MSIKIALATKLKSISALTALVSTRIYSVKLPQKFTLPAVVFRMTSSQTERVLSGNSGKARTTFEISYYDTTDTAAEAGGEIIRKALDGFRGTVSSVQIQSTIMMDRRDEFDYDIESYQRIMEFKIGHIEAVS